MWNVLTQQDLIKRLAERENNALNTAATAIDQFDVLADICVMIANDWRGKIAVYHTLDKRPQTLPSELLIHVLADFRYRAFTRLPNMSVLLDDLRVAEWRRAMDVMDALDDVVLEDPLPENIEVLDDGVPVIHVTWNPCG